MVQRIQRAFLSFVAILFVSACAKKAEDKPPADKPSNDKPATAEPAQTKPDAAAKARYFKGGLVNDLKPEDLAEFAEAQGDPMKGTFTLAQAFEGDPVLADKSKGKLTASFKTTQGDVACTLYEEDAPATVANFVGLARGVRPFVADNYSDEWKKGKFYDGLEVRGAANGPAILTGDPVGKGIYFPGYAVAAEIVATRKHETGALSMRPIMGPNSNGSVIGISLEPQPYLDGHETVFGQCDPKAVKKLSSVKLNTVTYKFEDDFHITSVVITRK